eukprot:jgi/Ulvmu1/2796/UM141_0003.1
MDRPEVACCECCTESRLELALAVEPALLERLAELVRLKLALAVEQLVVLELLAELVQLGLMECAWDAAPVLVSGTVRLPCQTHRCWPMMAESAATMVVVVAVEA